MVFSSTSYMWIKELSIKRPSQNSPVWAPCRQGERAHSANPRELWGILAHTAWVWVLWNPGRHTIVFPFITEDLILMAPNDSHDNIERSRKIVSILNLQRKQGSEWWWVYQQLVSSRTVTLHSFHSSGMWQAADHPIRYKSCWENLYAIFQW